MDLSNYSLHQASPHSSSSAEKSKLSLPIWASWDWGKTYLPHDIHTNQGEFDKALDLLYKYKFGDHDEGTSVVLGFGLLLRECWRAVEVEGDNEDSPRFLRESLLDITRGNQVIKVVKEVIGTLSSPETDEETLEKQLDSSAKGKKVTAGQKKAATRKHRTRTPSPAPSTTKKLSRIRTETNSPARNIRSQRQRKPSKKLRDSD